MEYYAGLDIGGTNGRLKLCAVDGQVLGEFEAEGCSINTDSYEKSRGRLRTLVLPALETLGLCAEQCGGICVAASGVDSPSLAASCRNIFEEMGFAKECLQVVNDCEIFLHLSDGPAIVIISGTGSICYGRDEQGGIFRTGGWNHILSDEGSGFDLGLKVLQATADALDGRIAPSALTAKVMEQSGLDSLEALNDFINENLFEKAKIAQFSRLGYDAACEGEETALTIHSKAADALFCLIRDTYLKLRLAESAAADLWIWGSVLVKNHIIQQMLADRIAAEIPGLGIRVPEASALDTALLAARNMR